MTRPRLAALAPRLPRRLPTRLRVVSLLLLAPLVAVATVSVFALEASRSTARSVDTALQQAREIDAVGNEVSSVLTVGEAFMASGDPEDNFAMGGAEASVEVGLKHLAAMPALTANQPRLVATATAAWHASAVVRTEVRMWAPDQDPTLVAKVADQFSHAIQTVSASLDDLRADNTGVVVARRNDLVGGDVASTAAVSVALVVGLIGALLLSSRLARSILRPLRRVRAATERLAAGDSADLLSIDSDDELAGLASAFNTMAERLRERQQAVELNERRLAALVENANDGILVVSAGGEVVFATPSLRAEFDVQDGKSAALEDRVHADDLDQVVRAWQRVLTEPDGNAQVEARLMHTDGSWRHVWARVSNRLADPAVAGIVLNVTDVSERHQYEQQLTWQALHDPLTGLANRELLRRRLDQSHGGRNSARRHSLLYLDLDDFKRVNDSFGHSTGDTFLKEVSARIATAVRPQDLVVRIGGDEFAVLLEGAAARQAVRTAERVVASLGAPLALGDRELQPSASVGVATVGAQATTLDSLMGDADLAMYFAKRRDKGGVQSFQASMRSELVEQVQLGEDLRHAVETNALTVAYQPVVRLRDGSMAGVEALARWEHPTRGSIPPATFIPLAEQLRLVGRIDQWVMRTACRQLRAWSDAGLQPIRVAVNISGSELANPDLPSSVRAILDECRLEPGRLELELTETVAVAESAAELAVVHELKDLGVHLSIDDFGTGYSALGRLRALPFDTLKVDKAFVDEVGRLDQGATLIETILEMAQMLGLDVVAEGVETPQQAAFLRQQDCTLAQGYFFSRPVEPAAIEAMLRVEVAPAAASGAA